MVDATFAGAFPQDLGHAQRVPPGEFPADLLIRQGVHVMGKVVDRDARPAFGRGTRVGPACNVLRETWRAVPAPAGLEGVAGGTVVETDGARGPGLVGGFGQDVVFEEPSSFFHRRAVHRDERAAGGHGHAFWKGRKPVGKVWIPRPQRCPDLLDGDHVVLEDVCFLVLMTTLCRVGFQREFRDDGLVSVGRHFQDTEFECETNGLILKHGLVQNRLGVLEDVVDGSDVKGVDDGSLWIPNGEVLQVEVAGHGLEKGLDALGLASCGRLSVVGDEMGLAMNDDALHGDVECAAQVVLVHVEGEPRDVEPSQAALFHDPRLGKMEACLIDIVGLDVPTAV